MARRRGERSCAGVFGKCALRPDDPRVLGERCRAMRFELAPIEIVDADATAREALCERTADGLDLEQHLMSRARRRAQAAWGRSLRRRSRLRSRQWRARSSSRWARASPLVWCSLEESRKRRIESWSSSRRGGAFKERNAIPCRSIPRSSSALAFERRDRFHLTYIRASWNRSNRFVPRPLRKTFMRSLIFKLISCSVVAVGWLSLFACSSSSSGSGVTGTSDSGASSDGATTPTCSADAGGNLCASAPSCATTVNGACGITTASAAGALPAFTGGTISDGTYFLTSATSYGNNGSAGQTQRITMSFTGGAFTLVQDSDVGCNSAPSAAGTASTSGTQLTLSITCPAADSEVASYTATSTTFSYSFGTGSSGTVFAFTRQ
jgi:hypothetical protein